MQIICWLALQKHTSLTPQASKIPLRTWLSPRICLMTWKWTKNKFLHSTDQEPYSKEVLIKFRGMAWCEILMGVSIFCVLPFFAAIFFQSALLKSATFYIVFMPPPSKLERHFNFWLKLGLSVCKILLVDLLLQIWCNLYEIWYWKHKGIISSVSTFAERCTIMEPLGSHGGFTCLKNIITLMLQFDDSFMKFDYKIHI